MSLIDSPAFHLSHSSFLRTADNPGRPGLAMPIPPIRPTQKTLPCCTDRLNLPSLPLGKLSLPYWCLEKGAALDAMTLAQVANPFIQTIFIVIIGLGYYFTIKTLQGQVQEAYQARTTGAGP